MLRYVTSMPELNRITNLVYRLLEVRITFFDLTETEVAYLDIKGMSPYCRARRKNAVFSRRCKECDQEHLKEAKASGEVLVYHCHDGLLEMIVPLYDRRRIYLGAIVCGQLRDPAAPVPSRLGKVSLSLFKDLKTCTVERARDMGHLLKHTSEYIIENELIRFRNKPWADTVGAYIENHLSERITMQALSVVAKRSTSFLSHHFPDEFGMSPKQYVLKRKMVASREMLQNGESVQNTAYAFGFYDPFDFSKRFKAYWGCSPRDCIPR